GTGKSKLAKAICNAFQGNNGYDIYTATSDWSTFETIGGYKIDENEELEFYPGIFLRCFIDKENKENNKWLIIDEINRADIDKAFGALFTALANDNVTIPFTKENRPIRIMVDYDNITFSSEYYYYYIPKDWRIIATMNTYDKSSLYEMSYAFMRRFAFIMVDIPIVENINAEKVKEFIECWDEHAAPDSELCKNIAELWKKVIESKRKIGPAIIQDIYNFVKRNTPHDFVGAINLFILPQFEGLLEKDIISAIKNIKSLSFIDEESKKELDEYASEFFLIDKDLF
ncbi:MAG: AAA family ATPase, partial [Promethearchaeota archaeon]